MCVLPSHQFFHHAVWELGAAVCGIAGIQTEVWCPSYSVLVSHSELIAVHHRAFLKSTAPLQATSLCPMCSSVIKGSQSCWGCSPDTPHSSGLQRQSYSTTTSRVELVLSFELLHCPYVLSSAELTAASGVSVSQNWIKEACFLCILNRMSACWPFIYDKYIIINTLLWMSCIIWLWSKKVYGIY